MAQEEPSFERWGAPISAVRNPRFCLRCVAGSMCRVNMGQSEILEAFWVSCRFEIWLIMLTSSILM
jgi:hypothetical protein